MRAYFLKLDRKDEAHYSDLDCILAKLFISWLYVSFHFIF